MIRKLKLLYYRIKLRKLYKAEKEYIDRMTLIFKSWTVKVVML